MAVIPTINDGDLGSRNGNAINVSISNVNARVKYVLKNSSILPPLIMNTASKLYSD